MNQDAQTLGKPLIAAQDLKVYFPFTQGIGFWKQHYTVRAVNGINFGVEAGETFGVVGESGCGKTTLGRALLSLVPKTSGEIFFKGKDIAQLNRAQMRSLRQHMQIVFQNPYAALNPRMTVGNFIGEPIRKFFDLSKQEVHKRVLTLLESVGLDPRFANRYPHEFSGGQRQRVVIARALATNPEFIVADEPVSALDVSIQAQILNLLKDLKRTYNLTLLFIAHDLTTVRYITDRVAVMYLGKIVEVATTEKLFAQPQHPYTQLLMASIPLADPHREQQRPHRVLEGEVPSPIVAEDAKQQQQLPACVFYGRCPERMPRCKVETPRLQGKGSHQTACHLLDERP